MSRVNEVTPQPIQAQSRVIIQQQPTYVVQRSLVASPVKSRQEQEQEDQEAEDAKSDKRTVNLLILLLPFLVAILFCIASIRLVHEQLNTEKTLEGADNVLKYVHHNLHADPVLSWRTTLSGDCPNDYFQAVLGKWEGINRGCLCKDGQTYRDESYLQCLPYKNDDCSYQGSYSSRKFRNWVDGHVEFCEKTLEPEKWEKKAFCDLETNTICGSSVCIKGKNAQCPPNNLEVSKLVDPSASLGTLLTKIGNNKYSQESTVTIRKQSKQSPPTPAIDMLSYFEKGLESSKHTAFIGLHISQGTTVCLNQEYARTDNVIYHLDDQQTQNRVCDQFGSLTDSQVYELDTTFQSTIYKNNNLDDIYTSKNLVDYDPQDYEQNDYHLLAIQKINVLNDEACNPAFKDHLNDAPKQAKQCRSTLRAFSWILFAFTILTVLLGVVFILAAIFKKISNQHNTKVKIARLYWFSSWVLVFLAFLIFLYYHVFFNLWLGGNEDELAKLKSANCFPSNQGIGIAIQKLIVFDKETEEKFGPIVNEIFWYGVIYSLMWMAIIAFWKNKYTQVKSFINNE